MTHEDVMQMLAETEIPFAYDHFAEGESPDPPFICFYFRVRRTSLQTTWCTWSFPT